VESRSVGRVDARRRWYPARLTVLLHGTTFVEDNDSGISDSAVLLLIRHVSTALYSSK
jgi:hypothetical protein